MNKRLPRIVFYLFPTIGNMPWLMAFFGVLFYGQRLLNADGDLALHLSMGRFILSQGKIPLQDVFSHTLAGEPAAQHKWLGQLIFGGIERFLGLGGVVLLCALVIAITFWLVYVLLRQESSGMIPVVVVILLALTASMVHWLIRPHVFTFLFLALWVLVLYQMMRGDLQRWWLLPVSMVLWVNLHGGFLAGLVTWALVGLGVGWEQLWGHGPKVGAGFWRFYLLSGGLAALITLLNPSGFGLWRLLVTHLGNAYLAAITVEFQSPNFHQTNVWPFLIMIGLLMLLLGLTKKRYPSGKLFPACAWLLMGLYSGRNIALFAIVSAPLLVHGLDDLFTAAADRFLLINRLKQADDRILEVDQQLKGFLWPALSLLVVLLGISLGLSFDRSGEAYAFDPEVFPVAAVDWLEQNPQAGEMFNESVWGGYLQYRLWPEKLVFIDSNSDFYGEEFVRQYMQVIMMEEGWEGVLEEYDVTWAILPQERRVANALVDDMGWEMIYEDDTTVILRR